MDVLIVAPSLLTVAMVGAVNVGMFVTGWVASLQWGLNLRLSLGLLVVNRLLNGIGGLATARMDRLTACALRGLMLIYVMYLGSGLALVGMLWMAGHSSTALLPTTWGTCFVLARAWCCFS